MTKHKLLLVNILLLLSFGISSQTLVKETSYKLFGDKEKGAKFSLESFKIVDGNIQVGALIQRKATIDNKKTFKVLKGGYFPAVKLFTFDTDLVKKDVEIENINLKSYTNINSDYTLTANKIYTIANSTDDISYEELQKQYPEILIAKDKIPENEVYFLEMEKNLKKKVYSYKFDIISNTFSKTETGVEKINLEYPATTLLRKKYGYGLSNDKFDRIILVSGLYYDKKVRKADKTKKWNEYRQYEFNSFDKSRKCLNTFNIDFDYPKIIKFYSKVETNGKLEGFVYVFGYMPGAKKYNNKETKNKYWIVYLDKNGKHNFTKELTSQYGTTFYTAHKFNNELNLLVSGNGGSYGIIKVSQDNYKQISLGKSLLENTIGGNSKQGIKRSFGIPVYDKSQVFVNDKGTFIVIFENKKTKSVKKGDKTITTTTYNSFALAFDDSGHFIKQFILPAKNGKSKSNSKKYNMITSTADKFVLLSEEAVAKYKAKPYSTFYTLNAKKAVKKNVMKHLLSPVVTVINISTPKVSSPSVSKEPFYILSKDVLYKLYKNNIYFVGTNKDRNNLVLTKMKY